MVEGVKTIVVFAAKGGAGKTTLALHLAVAGAQTQRVAVFDCDSQQRSAARWGDVRRASRPEPHVLAVDPSDARRLQDDARTGKLTGGPYELVVIDCPPRVDARSSAILAIADLIVVPIMPSALDIGALDASLRLIAANGKKAILVLNDCPPRAREVEEAVALLAHEAVPLAPIHIGSRRSYVRALAAGLTAGEYEPKGAAAAEISALYEYMTS